MFVNLIKSVSDKISPWLEESGYELVDIFLAKGKRKWLLRIYIDKPDGVTIDDCAAVSKKVGTILDVEDQIPGSYLLEVSSPGVERPLKKSSDFSRFMGETAVLYTHKDVSGKKFFMGKIGESMDGSFTMVVDEKPIIIEFSNIKKANLKYSFSFSKLKKK